MIRTEAQLTVSRFCELIGISRRGYYARRERHLRGPRVKGPWPTPTLDALESAVARIADAEPDWSHRRVWSAAQADGVTEGSASSVQRVLSRRGQRNDHQRNDHQRNDHPGADHPRRDAPVED
jgi:hypothetical protein